ncbi:alpha-D-ribose 1-methylphosphonate 5-triphosphate diphosphatase [Desulfotomaculum copahuensis]|uniref:Alpha-D-ribose 1-methylphosphonate 5-triphosphate diphosphatase n=1 Tax=Desulfotomaculum copahuensis TaxID=1838280 RepID=A0A1B7LH12_9FIRM|nr:alpha-D-ribose 1-methylphosphonate 5-triphosphate diphosphatase [Desulfotomaculum copahuensis]OAT85473.1 alpha-D-ribose 1-methylphosphonate 5-triphosphate diphosphatase [Desulfotomaculum copahuensis]
MNRTLLITNGRLVLPDRVLSGGEIRIENGIISRVGKQGQHRGKPPESLLDAEGGYVLPGLIDLHCDAIEKELEPRPEAFFDPVLAFSELEKKLAGQGITTMYHSFSFAGAEWGVRNDARAAAAIRQLADLTGYRSLIRNRVHLRFEITNRTGVDTAVSLLQENLVHLLSFMDHTPGQGQYPTLEDYRRYMEKTYHLPFDAVETIIAGKERGRLKADESIGMLSAAARTAGIPLASHDDDSMERVTLYRRYGATISEFPVNPAAARAASRYGNHVCVGAPNIVRGGSTGKGMPAVDAVAAGDARIICSDYYPPAMLQAVFKLAEAVMSLPEAVRLATLEPARAAGLQHLGSLAEGRRGDVIVVNTRGRVPVVTHTVVGGVLVYSINYRHSKIDNLTPEEQTTGLAGNGI